MSIYYITNIPQNQELDVSQLEQHTSLKSAVLEYSMGRYGSLKGSIWIIPNDVTLAILQKPLYIVTKKNTIDTLSYSREYLPEELLQDICGYIVKRAYMPEPKNNSTMIRNISVASIIAQNQAVYTKDDTIVDNMRALQRRISLLINDDPVYRGMFSSYMSVLSGQDQNILYQKFTNGEINKLPYFNYNLQESADRSNMSKSALLVGLHSILKNITRCSIDNILVVLDGNQTSGTISFKRTR